MNLTRNKPHFNTIKTSLLTGVSYMVPLIMAAGIMLALSHIMARFEHISITHLELLTMTPTTPWSIRLLLSLHQFSNYAFALLMPVIAGYVAYGFMGKPALAPGLIVGMVVQSMHMGFIGAMIGGILVASLIYGLRRIIVLPKYWQSIFPTVIVPVVVTTIACFLMKWVIGLPLEHFNLAMITWVKAAHGLNSLWIVALMGGMIGFDLGGPINKVALTVALGLYAQGSYGMVTATFAAAMVAPLGQGINALISRKYIPEILVRNAQTSILIGLVGVTEGAIPFVVVNPWLIIANVLGSALTGLLTVVFNIHLMAPTWGVLGWFLVDKTSYYILAEVCGVGLVVLISQFIVRLPKWFHISEQLQGKSA